MVLKWMIIIEIIITFILVLVLNKYIKSKNIEINKFIISIIGIIIFLISSYCTSNIPRLQENIEITALGERSPENQENDYCISNQVALRYSVVDGKKYELKRITDGKWTWLENAYMWKDESDAQQEEGVTRKIQISIPVGIKQSLVFRSSMFDGMVHISYRNIEEDVDLYLNEQYLLQPSGKRIILINDGLHIIAFLLIQLIMFGWAYLGISIFNKSHNEGYRFNYIISIIVFIQLLLIIPLLSKQCFWADELSQIYFSGGDNSIIDTIMMPETTPPFFRTIANIWYHIMPYGEQYLLLLGTFATAVSAFVIGNIGRIVKGYRVGIISIILVSFSAMIIEYCSFEFRSYSFLLLFSSLLLLSVILKYKSNYNNWKTQLFQEICMILICYTHYFGVILCCVVFLVDLFYALSQKKFIKFIVLYFILGIVYLPWVYRFLTLKQYNLTQTWMDKVTINNIYSYLLYLTNYDKLLLLFFLIGLFYYFLIVIKKQDIKEKNVLIHLPSIYFLLFFAIMIIFGLFINPKATLWVNRYFIVIIPEVICIIALVIDKLLNILTDIFKSSIYNNKLFGQAIIISIVFLFSLNNYVSVVNFANVGSHNNEDYREAAEWIFNSHSAYDDKTVIAYVNYAEGIAWDEYYLSKQGKRNGYNFWYDRKKLSYDDYVDELGEYDKIYLCNIHYSVENYKLLDKYLNENFDVVETNDNYKIIVYQRKTNSMGGV